MKKYVLGIDIGGTGVKMGIITHDGIIENKWDIPSDKSDSGKNILPDIVTSINNKLLECGVLAEEIQSIGVGVPGAVSDGKTVNCCVSLGWGVTNVSEYLENELWNIPVIIGNDANTAALGEMWKGAGEGCSNVVLLTIGTDIGGGVIVNGMPISGTFGGGGEIGHIPFNPHEKEPHPCGKCGCFGQYASGTGLTTLANRKLKSVDTASSLRDINLSGNMAKEVIDAAKSGDVLAKEIFEDYCDIFARGLAMVSCVVEPEVFILGGGVSNAGDFLSDNIQKNFSKYCFHTSKDVRIIRAKLTNDAGLIGAAKLALSI